MKTILSILAIVLLSNIILAQNTIIPDPNFEQALINLGYDSGPINGSVLTNNINTITQLNISSSNISSLTGIEGFIQLDQLWCSHNSLTTLSLTNNVQLTGLECNNNQLSSIDLTNNFNLGFLYLSNNQLTNINLAYNYYLLAFSLNDNPISNIDVTNNTALRQFDCNRSQLTTIDVSNNPSLEILRVDSNQLTNIDVTNNLALFEFSCAINLLTSLDVSQNTALDQLACHKNQLTSLDVSNNSLLDRFSCYNNQLTSLDLSNNTVLRLLIALDNQLNCLDIRNGNNSNMFGFFANNNPNLTCIEVDDVNYSSINWTAIDTQTAFSTNCSNPCSTVGIDEYSFTNLILYPNPTQGKITIDLGKTIDRVKLILTNNLGQIISIQEFESTNIINLNIEVQAGIYFLQIETPNGEIKTLKVLKE
jgi:Leucine-rich repeat (LRR) protein